MAEELKTPQDDERRVIETASATTSSDNHAGSAPIVIAVATVALLALLGSGVSGCTRFITNHMADNWHETMPSNPNPYEELDQYFQHDDSTPFGDDDLLDLLQQNDSGEKPDSKPGEGTDTGSTSSVDELLSSDLAIYGDTIDSLVSAIDYSGTKTPVRDHVRQVVHTDSEATGDIVALLRSALRGDTSSADALAKAKERAEQAAEELGALEAPEVDGENADAIASHLEAARTQAVERWKAIAAEMELLASSQDVSTASVKDSEHDISEATLKAAEELSQALRLSAGV